jgi:hypothetical protein
MLALKGSKLSTGWLQTSSSSSHGCHIGSYKLTHAQVAAHMAEGVAVTIYLGRICCGSQRSGRGVVLLWLVDRTRSDKIHYGNEGVWARVCNYPLRDSGVGARCSMVSPRGATGGKGLVGGEVGR